MKPWLLARLTEWNLHSDYCAHLVKVKEELGSASPGAPISPWLLTEGWWGLDKITYILFGVFPKLTAGIWSSFLLRWLWHWCLSVLALDWVGLSASLSCSASCLILSKLWVCFKSQVPLLQGRVTFIPASHIECLWESWDDSDKKPRAQGVLVCPQGSVSYIVLSGWAPGALFPFPWLLELLSWASTGVSPWATLRQSEHALRTQDSFLLPALLPALSTPLFLPALSTPLFLPALV